MPIDWNTYFGGTRSGLTTLIWFLGGGFVGTVLNMIYSRHQSKRELSLRLAEEYLKRRSDFSEVANLLRSRGMGLQASLARVEAAGDWLEVVATLHRKRLADRRLLRALGLETILQSFGKAVRECGNTELQTRLQVWQNLDSF